MKLNVLVTGCGGDIGQSIGKILKEEGFSIIIGTDLHSKHPGRFIFDHSLQISSCKSDHYLSDIHKLINEFKVDLIIPTSEPEIFFFHEHEIYEVDGKPVIMANPDSIEVGFDKLKTAEFLKNCGFESPKSEIIAFTDPIEFPIIVKPRRGSGGQSVIKVENIVDFEFYRNKYPEYLAQEYLSDQDGEYTCGLFSYNDNTRSIIFQRELHRDYTGYGIVSDIPLVNDFLEELAKRINLAGSINVQLRIRNGQPCAFEINPRFSSTVYFRHLLGFKDLIWSITMTFGKQIETFSRPLEGTEIFKGFQEFISKPTKS